MMDPDTVVIDVRNFNETVLGKFAPAQVLESSGEGGGEYSVWLCAVGCEALGSAECCALCAVRVFRLWRYYLYLITVDRENSRD
jgi:hypothetical protein